MNKVEYPEDCIRIRKALLELGYDLNLYEVERFWMDYSRKQGVGWFKPDETHLRDEVRANLSLLNDIPILLHGYVLGLEPMEPDDECLRLKGGH